MNNMQNRPVSRVGDMSWVRARISVGVRIEGVFVALIKLWHCSGFVSHLCLCRLHAISLSEDHQIAVKD